MNVAEHVHAASEKQKRGGGKPIEQRFVEYLEHLAGLGVTASGEAGEREINRAALAQLRRTLGKNPNEAVDGFRYVTRWVEDALSVKGLQPYSPKAEWCEECFYLVAALFAFYQTGEPRASWHHEESPLRDRNFGASFLKLEAVQAGDAPQAEGTGKERAKNLERRFTALLVSRQSDLPQRLRHAVSLLKSENVPVDWVQLLVDLQKWRSGEGVPYRVGDKASVQRRWAKSFWRVEAIDHTPTAEMNKADDLNEVDENETGLKTEEDEN